MEMLNWSKKHVGGEILKLFHTQSKKKKKKNIAKSVTPIFRGTTSKDFNTNLIKHLKINHAKEHSNVS